MGNESPPPKELMKEIKGRTQEDRRRGSEVGSHRDLVVASSKLELEAKSPG